MLRALRAMFVLVSPATTKPVATITAKESDLNLTYVTALRPIGRRKTILTMDDGNCD